MNDALKNLKNVSKAISLATAGIQLGAGIVTGQVPAITQAITKVIDGASFSWLSSWPGKLISRLDITDPYVERLSQKKVAHDECSREELTIGGANGP